MTAFKQSTDCGRGLRRNEHGPQVCYNRPLSSLESPQGWGRSPKGILKGGCGRDPSGVPPSFLDNMYHERLKR